MDELEEALTGEAAHVAPGRILEGLDEGIVHREVAGAPHTIYQEVWHIAFWLQMSLDWIGGIETPYPARPTDPFPDKAQAEVESWEALCQRLFRGLDDAADDRAATRAIRCEGPVSLRDREWRRAR